MSSITDLKNISACAWKLFQNLSLRGDLVFTPDLQAAYEICDHLNAFGLSQPVFVFPEMETDFMRNRGLGSRRRQERIVFWTNLQRKVPGVYLVSVPALTQQAPSLNFWKENVLDYKKGASLSCLELSDNLFTLGYEVVELVERPFQYAMRGSIVDVFSPLYEHPCRLELFGDEVESIHFFLPESQRRLESLPSIIVPPAHEFILPVEDKERKVVGSRVRAYLDENEWRRESRNELLERFDVRSFFSSIDYWASKISPSYFANCPWPDDILGHVKLHCLEGESLSASLQKNKALAFNDFLSAAEEGEWVPSPKDFLINEPVLPWEKTNSFSVINYSKSGTGATSLIGTLETLVSKLAASRDNPHHNPLEGVASVLKNAPAQKYFIFLSTSSEYERLNFLLGHYGLSLKLFSTLNDALESPYIYCCLLGSLAYPFRDNEHDFNFVSDEQLLGTKKRKAKESIKASQRVLDIDRSLSFLGLSIGSAVVHKEHGIAKYLGLKTMSLNGISSDFLELEFSDGKVFVPVIKLSLIQKYAGGEDARLDKLSTRSWEQKKTRAKKELRSIAGDLLALYSKRKLSQAPQLNPPKEKTEAFAASFPYTETPDQAQTIQDTLKDLAGKTPMDRVVCGDVGYGKTEVALRAAFACIESGHQAIVLVPTTLLAAQHYKTFHRRLSPLGFHVALLSRFTDKAEVTRIKTGLADGSIHAVVGTHKLLSNDLSFKNPGLLIVDEEHRFGVAHKEKIKSWRSNIHVLTLTATPIPRTMNMAMSGIRDLSIIATPPQSRLSVRTYVAKKQNALIVDAVTREIARGGQVFYVHNRVQDIAAVYEQMKELFPKFSMSFVHGQMEEDLLESRMLDFYEGKTQILITTSIIESGLDVPNANTLLIDRADRFGLAQLYQMRGRVGRSDKRAYAYLLIPEKAKITRDAEERLAVLESYQELGSGFHISTQDLDIRGAGDLLGRAQSGQISALGFEAFNELLQECMAEVRGEQLIESLEPEINLPIDLTIPDYYIREINLRLLFYRRLSSAQSESEVQELERELEDRFGPPPASVSNLVVAMEIKCALRRLRVRSLSSGKNGLLLVFDSQTPINPAILVEEIKKFPKHFHLHPDGRLALLNVPATSDPKALLRAVEAAISQIEMWCPNS